MSVGRIASRGSDQFPVRFPEGMRDRIKAEAEANGRSMNSEIVARLEAPSMTLRDYFAAKAMQGMLANPQSGLALKGFSSNASKSAYTIADALLAARKAKP